MKLLNHYALNSYKNFFDFFFQIKISKKKKAYKKLKNTLEIINWDF